MGQIITPPPFKPEPSGKIYLSGLQLNLVDTVPTLILLDTIATDFNDGIEDVINHRITPGVAGFYYVSAQALLINLVADKQYTLVVEQSGGDQVEDTRQASLIANLTLKIDYLCYLAFDEHLELWVTSYAGANTVDVYGQAVNMATSLSVQRVR